MPRLTERVEAPIAADDASGPVRVAMIGGGHTSAVGRTHVSAMRTDGRFALVAGCFSRDRGTNRASARTYGLPDAAAFPDLERLLDQGPQVDAVVVATPIRTHADQLHAVLDRGLTAISDKPLVHTAAAARELAARVGQPTTSLFTILNYTGYPAVRDLRSRVRRGDLGRLHRIVLEMPQDSYQRLVNTDRADLVQDWRLVDGASACVSLDLFVHLHSLAAFVTGRRLLSVRARSRSVTGIEPGLVDDVDAQLDFEDGLAGTAWYGKAALGRPNGLRVRLYGDTGSAEWDQSDPEWLRLADGSGRVVLQNHASPGSTVADDPRYQRFKAGHPTGFVEAFANYYQDIATSMRTGEVVDELLGMDTVVEGLAACEAIADSSATGAVVAIGAPARSH